MFPPKSILHATDSSPPSKAAFDLACSIARDRRADLLVVHVIPRPADFGGVAEARAGGYRKHLNDDLHAVRPTDPKQAVAHLLLDGDPATEIVETAAALDVGLIVLGTHGRTGISRLLMGSVAERVLRQAACPVLTVKGPPAPARPDPTPERWVMAGH